MRDEYRETVERPAERQRRQHHNASGRARQLLRIIEGSAEPISEELCLDLARCCREAAGYPAVPAEARAWLKEAARWWGKAGDITAGRATLTADEEVRARHLVAEHSHRAATATLTAAQRRPPEEVT